ncbi:Extracellular metalloprotease [Teratosphaeria destructans]|uniref:Extracellular metalloprotease n=1 Tax=Teratosphaeria destructans TaxID=418781 RepID=A0A9W7T0V7_9PEZI|nr:Extracellular metalloprotease [Teratosphaeria destructans]
MKSLTLAGVAILAAFASATSSSNTKTSASKYVPWSNGTHFTDPATNTTVKHFDCDVTAEKASDHFMQKVKNLHSKHKRSAVGTRSPRVVMKKQTVSSPITAKLYIHVIGTESDVSTITKQMAQDQATELNTAYNPYGITFTLQNISFTTNDAWAWANSTSDLDDAKAALRVGTYADLNLFFHTDLSGGMLGTCTLPSQTSTSASPSEYSSDGCNINANTMPGGSMTGYNQGKTAVHETGHWLGLLHTFEGNSCSGDGDYVADTPAESTSTDGCPTSPAKNSCGTADGDPIHNYMDYSTDACYEAFSADQVERISTMWSEYREGF